MLADAVCAQACKHHTRSPEQSRSGRVRHTATAVLSQGRLCRRGKGSCKTMLKHAQGCETAQNHTEHIFAPFKNASVAVVGCAGVYARCWAGPSPWEPPGSLRQYG